MAPSFTSARLNAHVGPPAARLRWLLLGLGLLLGTVGRAQAPGWGGAAYGVAPTGITAIRSTATDGNGNVFVTGNFQGTTTFGNTMLTSAGSVDLFVAKYVLATGTWAWAQRGGGTAADVGYGIAVSGSTVYVTGGITNTSSNASTVSFGGGSPATSLTQVNGATSQSSQELFLAKYIDNGTSATLGWTQIGGGTDNDYGYGVAVSGTSVYVLGSLYNDTANANSALFGSGGTTPGTVQVNGASPVSGQDIILAKYTDNGPGATLTWTQVGGGTDYDFAYGVAVSGTSVYVVGTIVNDKTNTNLVRFGGTGTTPGTVPQYGVSGTISADLLLAKYTDNGPSATLRWTQVGGGSGTDQGHGIAVSGTSLYVTGFFYNDTANAAAVVFGGGGTTPGASPINGASATASFDLLLAKYTDNGSTATYVWAQVAGGTDTDIGHSVAVSGTSVYVVGNIYNNQADASLVRFGGNGTTPGTSAVSGIGTVATNDMLLAKYTDNGSTGTYKWAQVGGGTGGDTGYSVFVNKQQVYAAGYVQPPATFGPTSVPTTAGLSVGVLARLTDPALPLAVRGAAPAGAGGLLVYPNPAGGGAATLAGAAPGAPVQVLDALGRVVRRTAADATGAAALAGLPTGLYLVRAGAATVRLSVD